MILDDDTVKARIQQAQLQFASLYAAMLEKLNADLDVALKAMSATESADASTTVEQDEDWDDGDDSNYYDSNDIADRTPAPKPTPRFKVGDVVRCRVCGEHRIMRVNSGLRGEIRYSLQDSVFLTEHAEDELELVKSIPKFKVGDYVRCKSGCGKGHVTKVHEDPDGMHWYEVEAPVYDHNEQVLELVDEVPF